MAARISKDGDVEIEFYIVKNEDGHISVWTDEPPPDRGLERNGPFVAIAQVTKRLAPGQQR